MGCLLKLLKNPGSGARPSSVLLLGALAAAGSLPVQGQPSTFPFTIQGDHFNLNGSPVFVHMIGYQPLEPGQASDGEIRTARVQDDLRRLREYVGGSSPLLVRVYAQPTAQFPNRMPQLFYDGIRELGFWVVRDIYFDPDFMAPDAVTRGKARIDAVLAEVEAAGAFDRIFSWEIGNEFAANDGAAISALQSFLAEMRAHIQARMAEPGREGFSKWVTWASWPPSDPLRTGCSPSPLFGCNPIHVPSLDYLSFNAYSYDPERMRDHQAGPVTGTPYAGYLAALSAFYGAAKPIVIAETGLPSSPAAVGLDQSRIPPWFPSYRRGALTQEQVASGLVDRYWDARLSGSVAGFGIFEWLDEWHKAGDPSTQSSDPEEHFGLARFSSGVLRFKLQQAVIRDLFTLRLPGPLPLLTGVTADAMTLSPTGTTALHAQVASGAQQPLRFRWESSRGRVVGDGPTVQFYAAGQALGPVRITVVASDLAGNASQTSLTLNVQAAAPSLEILTFGATRSSGRVSNVDLTSFKVVLYVHTDQYYVQPFGDVRSVWVRNDGYWWSTNFAFAANAELVAWLVPVAFNPPATMTSPPPGAIASAVRVAINDGDNDLLPDGFEPSAGQDRYDDPDGDGSTNLEEFLNGTNPSLADNDDDGDLLPDTWERHYLGTTVYTGADDPDGDGRSLAAELAQGTHPGRTNVDRDQDGLPDTWELRYFGNLSQGPNDQTGGVTNLDAYELGLVPDPIFVDGFETGNLSRWTS